MQGGYTTGKFNPPQTSVRNSAPRASSCAKQGGHDHVQLFSKSKGARGIEPETFTRRGQILSCHLTTGLMHDCVHD